MSWTGKKSPGGNAIKNYGQGDIVLIDFGRPNSGNEQEGRRPVLIVSNDLLNQTGLYWVVPITSTSKSFPTRIALDSRTVTTGYTLVDQLRSMDLAKKHPEKKRSMPNGHPSRSNGYHSFDCRSSIKRTRGCLAPSIFYA